MAMHRALTLIVGIIVVAHTALAQGGRILQAPDRIDFSPPRLESESELLSEYVGAFPSPVVSRYPVNNVVPVRAFVPKGVSGKVPVVIVLHYLGASNHKAEISLANDLARLGVASVLIALPYHLGRTPDGFRSGELAIQPDPAALVESMTQAVLDVRRAVDWIGTRPEMDSSRIGLAGTSLGSIVSTLVFAVEPRIGASAFVLGGVDLAHILWHSSRVVKQRDRLRRLGFTESKLREAITEVEPMRYLDARDVRPTFLVTAKFDTVVPPADAQKLSDLLNNESVLRLDTGHYGGVFIQQRVQRLVARFFAESFSGKRFEPPKSVYAPTVRLGGISSTDSFIQLGVGFDLWRSSDDRFLSTLFATPRGPQLFLGGRVDQSISVGMFAGPRKVSLGVVWSRVL